MVKTKIDWSQPVKRVIDRIEISDSNECWEWTGPKLPSGYGKQGARYPHRLMFLWFHHFEPDTVDHLCNNRSCQNPTHMESVSQSINSSRGSLSRDRKTCHRGHDWVESNIYTTPQGSRKCRKCRNLKKRQYRKEGRDREYSKRHEETQKARMG